MNHATVWPLCLALAGCQTAGYQQYADAMARIAEAQASVQREQAQMVMQLAQYSPDPGVKMAAVFMLGISGGNGWGGKQFQQPQPPEDQVLRYLSVILPSTVPVLLGLWNYKNTKQASKSASDTAQASYEAIFGVAKAGFDAAGSNITTNVTETTTTNQTSYSVGGSGVIGSGSFVLNPPPVIPPVVNPP